MSMMSNVSLLNPGTSLNFDGHALQSREEEEHQQEEEQQQQELRQLLTNALDDGLSVSSDEEDETEDGNNSSQQKEKKRNSQEIQLISEEQPPLHHTYPLAASTPANDQEQYQLTSTLPLPVSYSDLSSGHYNNSSNVPQVFYPQYHFLYTGHSSQDVPSPQHTYKNRLYGIGVAHDYGSTPPRLREDLTERSEADGANDSPFNQNTEERTSNLEWIDDKGMGFYREAYNQIDESYYKSCTPYSNMGDYIQHQNHAESGEVKVPDHLYSPQELVLSRPDDMHGNSENNFRAPEAVGPQSWKQLDGYRVQYKKRKDCEPCDPQQQTKPDESSGNADNINFMQAGGDSENKNLAQLKILYKARGRKLEEINKDFDNCKQESAREVRILKHKLTMAEGEKEGMATSLKGSHELLQEAQMENTQLQGRLEAAEAHIQALQKGKEEAVKKLQMAEASIESLNQQLHDLVRSDTLERARLQHEALVSGIRQKHQTEILVLKEQLDDTMSSLSKKTEEASLLQKQLSEAIKATEHAQISRAETINRLTRSLEDSQRQCQNLLESSPSQEIGQLKIQLQHFNISKTEAEQKCQSLQEEVKNLKEQLSMLESATNLGAFSQHGTPILNDSLVDLGIKRQLNFKSPEFARVDGVSGDFVQTLKSELERCIISNKEKRAQVTQLQDALKMHQKDIEEWKTKYERADNLVKENSIKLNKLMKQESETKSVEDSLQKETEDLKLEQEAQKTEIKNLNVMLAEASETEERLLSTNNELKQRISQTIKQCEEEKTAAIETCRQTYERFQDDVKEKLREDLTSQFDAALSTMTSKHKAELGNLRSQLDSILNELDEVKEMYVKVCKQKDQLEDKLQQHEQQKERCAEREVVGEPEKTESKAASKSAVESEEQLKGEILQDYKETIRVELEWQIRKELEEKKEQEVKEAKRKMQWECEQTKVHLEEQLKKQWREAVRQQVEVEPRQKTQKEKDEEVAGKIKGDLTNFHEQERASFQEQLCKEQDAAFKRKLDVEIAEARLQWLKEQKILRQSAIEGAVKAAEEEWRLRREAKIEFEVNKRLANERNQEQQLEEKKWSDAKKKWEEQAELEKRQSLESAMQRSKEAWEKAEADRFERIKSAWKQEKIDLKAEHKDKWEKAIQELCNQYKIAVKKVKDDIIKYIASSNHHVNELISGDQQQNQANKDSLLEESLQGSVRDIFVNKSLESVDNMYS